MTKLNKHNICIFQLLLCCVLFNALKAQKNIRLTVHPVSTDVNIIASLNIQVLFDNKTECIQYVNKIPAMLAAKGFAAASVDSVWEDSNSVFINLFAGEKYQWKNLLINNADKALLASLGFNADDFSEKNFLSPKLEQLYNAVIDYYGNNGYPFVNIFLDSIQINQNKIQACLKIVPGNLYYVDTIIVEGNMRVSKYFLQQYLQIEPHSLYNQSKLNTINQRLALLSYLQQSQPWQMEMLNNGGALHLYLRPTKNNSVNVLLGLLPQNNQTGGKLLLTGQATVGLRNSFGLGETIGLNWQQLQPKSPQLNLSYQQPYMFRSPFGFGVNFQLYKQDSAFVNINGQLAVQYELSQHQTGAVLFQTNNTNVLNVDTNMVKLTNVLPAMADVHSASIGIQYNFYNTDYRFNPRRGNDFLFVGSFGNKNIKKNNAIENIKDPNFNANNLYDTVKLKSYQFRVQFSEAKYFPVGKLSAFKLAVNTGLYQSPNTFQNELFRLGGFKLLRGFDEESIYANRYSVGTIEYHYLLGRNSWFYGFTDLGWADYDVNDVKFNHTYFGFGVGLSLETGTGIFSISLAEGKRDDSKLNFQQSKIHIGFISLF